LDEHRAITSAVHAAGGKIAMQIVHSGRYAKHDLCVGPSAARARINPIAPRVLRTEEVWQTVADFAHTATLAREGGHDGVEIMGSEGYLINEFTAPFTNDRKDEFGGSFDNRVRFALEVIRAIRRAVGRDFIIVYRISAVDLVDGGMDHKEVAQLARLVQEAGANIINTGIGWHESGVPTIAAPVPRATWAYAIANVKQAVDIPVIGSNRINTPEGAEDLLATRVCDLVSMARPMLADPDFAKKVRLGVPEQINTCIACNQACLDRIFTEQTATCLVNPRAGREIEFSDAPAAKPLRVAVVGGGPAGMAFAVNAAERGHRVSLFEAAPELGGQLNLARVVPGKNEFNEMLRYFRTRLQALQVDVRLKTSPSAAQLADDFDQIVVATGVRPRIPELQGVDHPKVVSYVDILSGRKQAGERVAVIGAGGIGFDVSEFLVGDHEESLSPQRFLQAWGVDPAMSTPGGLAPPAPAERPPRQVTMVQRKDEPLGRRLGKSTGWILKAKLKKAQVQMIQGATYTAVDDAGLHYLVNGQPKLLAVDTVVLCAGQESERGLFDELKARNAPVTVIGGADVAAELDALRAIEQATRLAVAM
jgi:2,4-dienoyl-CoA reductase (NADPH2)